MRELAHRDEYKNLVQGAYLLCKMDIIWKYFQAFALNWAFITIVFLKFRDRFNDIVICQFLPRTR
ncbi:hypothetical protein D1115_06520 [Vibrio alfacsensis]|uniref:Uncharacterized protein n=1 Tax=Vibrio alfacsensis TaxID=1074311 RepID=A0ABM6YTF0_9VIBR|nr:hypothetical protein D1115_06520 [Vibrio alfacsensis]